MGIAMRMSNLFAAVAVVAIGVIAMAMGSEVQELDQASLVQEPAADMSPAGGQYGSQGVCKGRACAGQNPDRQGASREGTGSPDEEGQAHPVDPEEGCSRRHPPARAGCSTKTVRNARSPSPSSGCPRCCGSDRGRQWCCRCDSSERYVRRRGEESQNV